jgi:hypothetical protein
MANRSIAGGLVLMLVLFSSACGDVRSYGADLNPGLGCSYGYVVVENHDTFDWKQVRVIVNSLYYADLIALRAGQSVQLLPREFIRGDGTILNFELTACVSVSVHATAPNGAGYVEITNSGRRLDGVYTIRRPEPKTADGSPAHQK